MKKLIMMVLMAVPLMALSQTKGLYTANYSSKFTIADASYSDKVLTLWKDFENNALDKHVSMFSDTVSMMFPDGNIIKGKAENLASVKAFRGSITNYKATVDAFVSLKSTDRDENVVCIWGIEDYTDKDGKHVKQRVQEVWGFNKDGKVSLMIQYAGKEM
jgi:ketosteroid isomerase-like protein